MPSLTPRWQLPYPQLSETADVPRDMAALAIALDKHAQYDQGLFSNRPVAAKIGRYYFATDNAHLYLDIGTAWVAVGTVDPDSITNIEIAPGAVTSLELADNAVQLRHMSDNSVSAAEIVDGTVGSAEIAPGLKPSQGAGGSTEALRAIGYGAGQVAAGTHGQSHRAGGSDQIASLVTSLPGGATDGQECYLWVASGVIWHLRYHYNAGGWEFLGGGSQSGIAEGPYTRNTDGNWSGPHISVNIPAGGQYEVTWGGTGIGADLGFTFGIAGPGLGLATPQASNGQGDPHAYHGHGFDGTSRTRMFTFSSGGVVHLYVHLGYFEIAGGELAQVTVNRMFLHLVPAKLT